MTPRWTCLLALLLTGCVTDEFVIFGETDGCSSGEADEAAAEIDAPPVKKSVPAEMSSRPAPRARPRDLGSTTPRNVTLPVDAPAQER